MTVANNARYLLIYLELRWPFGAFAPVMPSLP